MSELQTIKIPDIGDTDDVEIIEILVAEGDTVDVETSLVTVESDEASHGDTIAGGWRHHLNAGQDR